MGTNTQATVSESNPARGEIRGIREINRRKMKAPRPAMTSTIKYRVRLWYTEIERARVAKVKNGGISKAADRYLRTIKGLPTVQAGGWCDVRDNVMAKWLNCSRHTVLRYREQVVAAKLLEDKGTRGRDHKPCLVRPIMSDGSPVFMISSATPSVAATRHEQASLLELPGDSSPPTPSQLLSDQKKECGPSLDARDTVDPCGPSPGATTLPKISHERPTSRRRKLSGSEGVEARPEPITVDEFIAATDGGGIEGATVAEWGQRTYDDKLAIAGVIKALGHLKTGKGYLCVWLRERRWQPLVAAIERAKAAASGVRVEADSPEGRAWLDHWKLRGEPSIPVVNFYFICPLPSRWPPSADVLPFKPEGAR